MSLPDYQHHIRPDHHHPLSAVMRLAKLRDWDLVSDGRDEVQLSVTGSWTSYRMRFAWTGAPTALHCACAMEIILPAGNRADIHALMAAINEKLWLGHFALWEDQGLPVFRYTLLPDARFGVSDDHIEEIVDLAVGECERFAMAFQLVANGQMCVPEAMGAALMETGGTA